MNFKKFTLKQLKKHLEGSKYIYEVFVDHSKDIHLDDVLTISDHGILKVEKGCENLYLTISVYKEKEYEEYELYFYTKEYHNRLKSIIREIIKQM